MRYPGIRYLRCMNKAYLFGLFLLLFGWLHAQTLHQSALQFDGNGDYISTSQAGAAIGNSAAFSMAFWVMPLNANPAWPNFDGFAGFRNDAAADFYIVQLTATRIECRFRGSNGVQCDLVFDSLLLNTWQHFALVKTASKMYLYHNAELKDSVSAPGSMSNPGDFTIGRLVYSFNDFDAFCRMDEVGLWSRALSAQDVQCLYAKNIPVNTNNLVLGYTFNEGVPYQSNTIAQVSDLSGSFPGILNGFSLQDSSSNFVNGINPYAPVNASTCIGTPYFFQGDTLLQAGRYYYDIAGAGGCDSLVELNLQVVSPPDTSFSISTPNGMAYILNATQSGAGYQWCTCNAGALSPLAGATQQTYNAGIGNIEIALVVSNGLCADTSSCYALSSLASLSEKTSNLFTVLPNPAHGRFQLSSPAQLTGALLRIQDAEGRIVLEKTITASTESFQLNAPGLYFVSLEANGMLRYSRLINLE